MHEHLQFSLRNLLCLVTALGIASGVAALSPLTGGLIATLSVAAFCASLRAAATGTLLLHSLTSALLIISSVLVAILLGTTVLKDPRYRVSPSAHLLVFALVLIVGGLLKYFAGYRNRDLVGAIILCEAVVFMIVLVQSEPSTLFLDYAAGLVISFHMVILPTLIAMLCPNRRTRNHHETQIRKLR